MIKEIMLLNTSEIINVIQTKVTTFIVTVKYDLSILYYKISKIRFSSKSSQYIILIEYNIRKNLKFQSKSVNLAKKT